MPPTLEGLDTLVFITDIASGSSAGPSVITNSLISEGGTTSRVLAMISEISVIRATISSRNLETRK